MENVGARYGIWSNIPNYGQVRDVGEVALGTGDMVSNLLNKHYKNRMEKMAAEEAARTMESNVLRKNTENNVTAQYFEPEAREKLNQARATVGMTNAHTGLYGAQTGAERARANLYGKHGNYYDAESERALAQAGLLGAQKNGVLGNNQWMKDLRMGSQRSGAGGTYINPETGEIVSTDTTAQATRDQKAIAGSENVKEYVGQMMDTLPQFLTGPQRLGVFGKGLANYTGLANYEEPSQLAAGDAALAAASEGIVNTFQLNATNENLQRASDIIRPHRGESPYFYRKRVEADLTKFIEQERRAQNRLAGGTDVTPPPGQRLPAPTNRQSAGNQNDPLGIR